MSRGWRQKCPACGQWIEGGTGPDTGSVPACAGCGWRAPETARRSRSGGGFGTGLALAVAGAGIGAVCARLGDAGVWGAVVLGPGAAALAAWWSRGFSAGWLLVFAAALGGAFRIAAPGAFAAGSATSVAILAGILTLAAGAVVGAWSRWRSS